MSKKLQPNGLQYAFRVFTCMCILLCVHYLIGLQFYKSETGKYRIVFKVGGWVGGGEDS